MRNMSIALNGFGVPTINSVFKEANISGPCRPPMYFELACKTAPCNNSTGFYDDKEVKTLEYQMQRTREIYIKKDMIAKRSPMSSRVQQPLLLVSCGMVDACRRIP